MRMVMVTAAAVGLVLGGAAVSTAAPAKADYCVLNVDTGDMACYGSAQQASTSSVAAAAPYLLGIWYDWINHDDRGGKLEFKGSHPCTTTTTDIDYYDLNLADGTWNNRVSSLTTANHCDFKLYDGANYGPPATGWIDNSNHLGTVGMYNKASSYKIS